MFTENKLRQLMPRSRHKVLDVEFDETIRTGALDGMRQMEAGMLKAVLNKTLHNQIDTVEIVYEVRTREDIVGIRFYNGHTISTPLSRVHSKEFIATCVMICDLPRKE